MTEILGMLTASGVNWQGSGGGGEAKLTPQMVAAACKDIPMRIFLYAMLKFCQDLSVRKELYQITRSRAHFQAAQNRTRWKLAPSESPDNITRVALLALRQSIVPRLCKKCKGLGVVTTAGGEVNECVICKGSGQGRELSGRVLADVLGVSHKRVRTFWRFRFSELQQVYANYDVIIHEEIQRKLRDDDVTLVGDSTGFCVTQ